MTESGLFKHPLRVSLRNYFLLVVVALMFLYNARPGPQEPGQMWMVTGHLTYDPAGEQYPVSQTLVQTIPPADIDENGNFRIYVLKAKDSTNAMRFPDLQFSSPGYRPATVHLNSSMNGYAAPSYRLTPDEPHHAIGVVGDIVLERETTNYKPEGSLAIH
jgi:hypothetical protein